MVEYTYDAWGNVLSITGMYADTLGVNNPIRYRGYYQDFETGFYYLQSRYYDPAVRRFINADGYINANDDLLGYNMYAYCGNNPVNRNDDGGMFWDTIFDVVSLVVSVVEVVANPTDPWAWAGLVGDAIDLIPFVSGVGEVTRAVKTTSKVVDKVNKAVDALSTARKVDKITDGLNTAHKFSDFVDNTSDGIKYTDKVIKQMSNASDINHSFPVLIDSMVDLKMGKPFTGGDGIMRWKVEIPGSVNNRSGIFEYIIEPNGMCNHRFFRFIGG